MRRPWMALGALLGWLHCGCASIGHDQLTACHRYNSALQGRYDELGARHEELRDRNGELAQANLDLEMQLEETERLAASLQTELASVLVANPSRTATSRPGSIPNDIQLRLTAMAQEYPGIVQIDPSSGISRFQSDLLFPPGSAELSVQATAVLAEFAGILSHSEASELQLMIVGHTDVDPVASPTGQQLDSNWHLSVHRAIAVARFLEGLGVDPQRLATTGYGHHQPISNVPAENRRVELFLIPLETPMVGTTMPQRRYR